MPQMGYGMETETVAGSKHWKIKTKNQRCTAQYLAVGLELCGYRGGWGGAYGCRATDNRLIDFS